MNQPWKMCLIHYMGGTHRAGRSTVSTQISTHTLRLKVIISSPELVRPLIANWWRASKLRTAYLAKDCTWREKHKGSATNQRRLTCTSVVGASSPTGRGGFHWNAFENSRFSVRDSSARVNATIVVAVKRRSSRTDEVHALNERRCHW